MSATAQKLEILADAAKYDASCASSGARSEIRARAGIGSTNGIGICHSYTPDGRCVSLLKILLTNSCIFDCAYCINRRSSNVRRARFTVKEVVDLTLDFYRRNYIEGLFLSSGIIRSPDYTMEQLVRVARSLREEHGFRGYIHLKSIPDAAPELIAEAGRHADRLSINIELPTRGGPEGVCAGEATSTPSASTMAGLRLRIDETKAEAKAPTIRAGRTEHANDRRRRRRHRTRPSCSTSATLYASYDLKRIYYSAFSPIPDASSALPAAGRAAAARASALPGRLAVPLLRVLDR